MTATYFLDSDKSSFSKILLSKEVADIIKQIVKESVKTIYPKSDDLKKIKNL